jgi:cysteine synthase A
MNTDTTAYAAPRGLTFQRADDMIGGTPLLKLSRMVPEDAATVLLKMESENPLKSVKDRIGRAMIDAAEQSGELTQGGRVIEPTSGNTGIALAFICATRGYPLTLTMPETMSLERRAMLHHLGAEIVLTPGEKGMKGAVALAQELYEQAKSAGENVFMPAQFDNPANPRVHEQTTGPEIWADTQGNIDAIVAGVGTGGTITGVTRFIRTKSPAFKAIAVEPEASPVISGGEPGPHKIQGIGAGFVPRNLDVELLDGIERVSNDEAFETARRLAREEGVLGGISAGANVAAAIRVATRPEFAGKTIVTICCSFAERYLSTPLFETPGA